MLNQEVVHVRFISPSNQNNQYYTILSLQTSQQQIYSSP